MKKMLFAATAAVALNVTPALADIGAFVLSAQLDDGTIISGSLGGYGVFFIDTVTGQVEQMALKTPRGAVPAAVYPGTLSPPTSCYRPSGACGNPQLGNNFTLQAWSQFYGASNYNIIYMAVKNFNPASFAPQPLALYPSLQGVSDEDGPYSASGGWPDTQIRHFVSGTLQRVQ